MTCSRAVYPSERSVSWSVVSVQDEPLLRSHFSHTRHKRRRCARGLCVECIRSRVSCAAGVGLVRLLWVRCECVADGSSMSESQFRFARQILMSLRLQRRDCMAAALAPIPRNEVRGLSDAVSGRENRDSARWIHWHTYRHMSRLPRPEQPLCD